MKYFTTDLLDKINNQSLEHERKKYEDIWRENIKLYWEEFKKISKQLPQEFVGLFQGGHLHDATIEEILFKKRALTSRNEFEVILRLTGELFSGELIHSGVITYNTSLYELDVPIGFEYLYGEILFSDGFWTHNFLLFNGSEVEIKCKKIKWRS